ncbi:MAG: two-component system sensor histidine kinase NtrB [bacterium]
MAQQEKSRLEDRLHLFYSAFQHSTDAIILTDLNGIIIEANHAFSDLFGWAREETVGKSTRILRSTKTSDEFYRQMWESVSQKGRWQGEIVNRRKDGSDVPVLLSITPIYQDGEKIGYMGVEIDITEKKKIETELKSLEKQVLQADRWATIGKMAAKVAHEIRNPLSSISLNAELLGDEIADYQTANTDEASALLKSIISEVDRVTALTEEYLQFSRLPQVNPTKGSLDQTLHDVLELLRHDLRQKKIEVQFQGERKIPETLFDRAQIRRVFLNIIRNAMEAMPKGGLLTIQTEEKDHRAVVHIADTGMGIPEEALAKIFDPFFTTKDFGTGLGLAIVQQIIDEHNGQISCQSRVGEGTTFSIALPLDKTE